MSKDLLHFVRSSLLLDMNDRRKHLDPILGAALIAGGSSLVGSLLGYSSNQSTNAQNAELMREQNQFNAQQAWQNQVFQQDFWRRTFDETNKYNLPKNQVKRLLEAGINPALMSGQVQAVGSVGSSTPGAQAHAAETAKMIPTDFSGLGRLGVDAANIALSRSQAKNLDADTLTKTKTLHAQLKQIETQTDFLKSEIEYRKKQGLNIDEQTKQLEFLNTLSVQVRDQMVLSYTLNNKQLQAAIDDQYSQIDKREFDAWFSVQSLEEQKRLNSANIDYIRNMVAAEFRKIREAERTGKANRDYLFAQRQEIASNIQKLGVDTRTAQKISQFVVDKAAADAQISGWEAEHPYQSRLIGPAAGTVGSAAGAFVGAKGGKMIQMKPVKIKGFSR